ncbi:MAG TPA: hypothetical protein VN207_01405 [Ktedonobacteraceae bacterium]|nr:hypothetical protein [Ktedonobacteraceae bacterium]
MTWLLQSSVTTPHGEIQGLLARAERNIPACGSFAKAPSEPTVSSISVGGLWALKTYVINWHTKRLGR